MSRILSVPKSACAQRYRDASPYTVMGYNKLQKYTSIQKKNLRIISIDVEKAFHRI